MHFGSALGEAIFTGLTGTDKGELSMHIGCSLLSPGVGESMMQTYPQRQKRTQLS